MHLWITEGVQLAIDIVEAEWFVIVYYQWILKALFKYQKEKYVLTFNYLKAVKKFSKKDT